MCSLHIIFSVHRYTRQTLSSWLKKLVRFHAKIHVQFFGDKSFEREEKVFPFYNDVLAIFSVHV